MRIHDQVISVVTQFNQGVGQSTLPGEAHNILVVYPLLVVLAVGLFAGACEFWWQRREQRSALGAIAMGIMTAMLAALFIWFWMGCSCDGADIYKSPLTAGRLCGARGTGAISLMPLFRGCVTTKEDTKWNRDHEAIRVIDALISLSIESGLMNTTCMPHNDEPIPT